MTKDRYNAGDATLRRVLNKAYMTEIASKIVASKEDKAAAVKVGTGSKTECGGEAVTLGFTGEGQRRRRALGL